MSDLSKLIALYLTQPDTSDTKQILEQIEILLQKELIYCKQLQNLCVEHLIQLKEQRNRDSEKYWRPLI
jgi:hypothetical protein